MDKTENEENKENFSFILLIFSGNIIFFIKFIYKLWLKKTQKIKFLLILFQVNTYFIVSFVDKFNSFLKLSLKFEFLKTEEYQSITFYFLKCMHFYMIKQL